MKKLFKLGFMSLILSSLMVMSGCYKSDINRIEDDLNDLRNTVNSKVETIDGQISTLQSATTELDKASKEQKAKIEKMLEELATKAEVNTLGVTVTSQGQLITSQGNRITDLERDLSLTNPESALNLAMALADLQTLSDAKEYADGLSNALQSQINTIKGFVGFDELNQFVVNEAAPNDMLNGEYANLGAFVNTLTVHLSILKGEMEAIAERVTTLEDALGTKGVMWGETVTAWEAIGQNYGEIQTLKGRLNNVAGLDMSLEEYVENVNQFKADTEALLAELEGRFAGWDQLDEGVTIIDYIALALGDLMGENWDDEAPIQPFGLGGTQYANVTEMVNGEIANLKLYTEAQISELKGYTDDEIARAMGYTDSEIDSVKKQIIEDLESLYDKITGEYKRYTDDEIVDALSEAYGAAKGYTDGEIGGLKTTLETAIGELDQKVDSLKNFTIDELAALDLALKGYTDVAIADLHKHLHKVIGKEIRALDKKLTKKINEDLEALGEKLTDYIDDEIAALKGELLGVMQEMVTGIAVMSGKDGAIVYDGTLNYPVITQLVTRTFGPEGQQLDFLKDSIVMANGPHFQSMLVKVTPDNAKLNAKTDFVLFDTQKNDYLANGAYDIEVKEYDGGILTRGSVENTGLWIITLTMKDQRKLPVQSALLSLGIVNNMVENAADPNRVVSTGPVVEIKNSVASYTPAYYYYRGIAQGTNPVYNVKIGSTTRTINNFSNSSATSWWSTTPPSVNATTGVVNNGTASSGDARLSTYYLPILGGGPLSNPLRMANVGSTVEVAPIATVPNGLFAWYVDFKSAVPSVTDVEDWGDLNVLRSTEIAFEDKIASDIATPVVITVPANNALHREVVEFNVQGVNIDGTMVDPDGVPFRVGIVAPDYDAPVTALTVQLENYPKSTFPGTMTFDTDPIAFSVADLGFTEEFMNGLTTTYSIRLALNPALTHTNSNYGKMQVSADGMSWVDVVANTVWKDVEWIRFTNVDPCAMASGAIYTGTLVLTETVATTAPGVESNPPYVLAVEAPAIKLTFPITLTLGSNMPFGTDMMNFKPNMGADNKLIVWPVADGSGGATYDFDSAFDYGAGISPDVVFKSEDGFPVSGHTITVPNITSHLSQEGAIDPHVYTAYYLYGPVYGGIPASYSGGFFQQPWEEGTISVEFRNRMDWVTSNDVNKAMGLPTTAGQRIITASEIVFTPIPNSGQGSTTFTLAQAISQDWVTTSGATAKIFIHDSGDVATYFTLNVTGNGHVNVNTVGATSLDNDVVLDLVITIKDQFGLTHEYTHTITLQK